MRVNYHDYSATSPQASVNGRWLWKTKTETFPCTAKVLIQLCSNDSVRTALLLRKKPMYISRFAHSLNTSSLVWWTAVTLWRFAVFDTILHKIWRFALKDPRIVACKKPILLDYVQIRFFSLHSALAAAQCIVIGPVCVWVCGCVCEPVTTITRNCVHQSSPNWVCR